MRLPPKRNFLLPGLGLVIAGAMAFVALPVAILVILGFLPTFGAWVAEGPQNRLLTRCVGAMNLCGVLPFALELWLGGGQLPKLSGYLSDPFIWLAMYGAAALGWLLYLGLPPLVEAVTAHRVRERLGVLATRQHDLMVEWGEDVGEIGTSGPLKIRRG